MHIFVIERWEENVQTPRQIYPSSRCFLCVLLSLRPNEAKKGRFSRPSDLCRNAPRLLGTSPEAYLSYLPYAIPQKKISPARNPAGVLDKRWMSLFVCNHFIIRRRKIQGWISPNACKIEKASPIGRNFAPPHRILRYISFYREGGIGFDSKRKRNIRTINRKPNGNCRCHRPPSYAWHQKQRHRQILRSSTFHL